MRNKALKKITAAISLAAIFITSSAPIKAMEEQPSDGIAVVTFGKYITTKNVNAWEFNLWDNGERVVRDERE